MNAILFFSQRQGQSPLWMMLTFLEKHCCISSFFKRSNARKHGWHYSNASKKIFIPHCKEVSHQIFWRHIIQHIQFKGQRLVKRSKWCQPHQIFWRHIIQHSLQGSRPASRQRSLVCSRNLSFETGIMCVGYSPPSLLSSMSTQNAVATQNVLQHHSVFLFEEHKTVYSTLQV